MDDSRFTIALTICGVVVLLIGFIAGVMYSEISTPICDSQLDTCNSLLDYCSASHNLLPQNCSNPIYKSDNYWYCEVN